MSKYQLWDMPAMFSEQDQEIGAVDAWIELSDPTERRKRQNRLNQRAARQRQMMTMQPVQPQSLSQNLATQFSSSSSANFAPVDNTNYGISDLTNNMNLIRASDFHLEPPPLRPGRKKVFSRKVKTGCLTCRKRRVKCDEAKPHCSRCVKAGRSCDGYTQHSSPVPTTTITGQPELKIFPTKDTPSSQDMKMLHILSTEILVEIASPKTNSFWLTDILQAGQLYPAIWHALLAVGATHQGLQLTGSSCEISKEDLDLMAINHYNLSIKQVLGIVHQRGEPSFQDQETLLVANILFTTLCSLRGDQPEAMIHARNGLQLFRQWKTWHMVDSSKPRRLKIFEVNDMFLIFGLLKGQLQPLLSGAPKPVWKSTLHKTSSKSFVSVRQAHTEFVLMLSSPTEEVNMNESLLSAVQRRPEQSWRLTYRHQFTFWKARFQKLKARKDLDTEDRDTAYGMYVWEIFMEILLDSESSESELGWDNHEALFRGILDTIEEMHVKMNQEKNNQGQQQQPPLATTARQLYIFADSFAGPLFFISKSCRDGGLRRRALNLLAKCPCQVGIWNVTQMTSMIQAMVQFEEGTALPHDPSRWGNCDCIAGNFICDDHRVKEYYLKVDRKGFGDLIMRTTRDVDTGGLGTVVGVAW